MLGHVGMGPIFWQNRIKKCAERRVSETACDLDATHGCCAVVACTYCLELECYGGIQYGTAEWDGGGWSGAVDGHDVDMFWEKEVDDCYFVVLVNGEEVYRGACEAAPPQSCRDSSATATVEVDYEECTLRWERFEPLALPLVQDPHTNCQTWFCGECHCTSEVLCVYVTTPDGDTCVGEATHTAQVCVAPMWEGTVDCLYRSVDVSLTLRRDNEGYGGCQIGGQINGEDVEWLAVDDCLGIDAEWTLSDYTAVRVTSKNCNSCQPSDEVACCGRGNIAYDGCGYFTSVSDPCVNASYSWDYPWSPGSDPGLPATSITWADLAGPLFSRASNYINSIPGCDSLESETHFRAAEVDNVDPAHGEANNVQDCDWVVEVYHRSLVGGTGPWIYDGVFYEYTKSCGCGRSDSSNVLRWVKFHNIPIGGGIATAELTITRYGEGQCNQPLTNLC